MKTIISFCFLFLSIVQLHSQDAWGLMEIIAGSWDAPGSKAEKGVQPNYLEKDAAGGVLEVLIRNKVRSSYCNTSYRFEWQFSKPLSQLQSGDVFEVTYQVKPLNGNCQSADARMVITPAVGFSKAYRSLGIKGSTGGIAFPKFKVPNEKWVYANKRIPANTAYGKVKPWGGQYATIRLNFESQNQLGSDRLHFEVVYVFKKGFRPNTTSTDSNRACPYYNSWYWPAEDNHPWQGMGIHKLRQQGYKETYYYSSTTAGGSYFLKDPNDKTVRIHGSKVYYVNWDCFEKHWEYVRTQDLSASGKLSYAKIYRRRDTGTELVFNFLK